MRYIIVEEFGRDESVIRFFNNFTLKVYTGEFLMNNVCQSKAICKCSLPRIRRQFLYSKWCI